MTKKMVKNTSSQPIYVNLPRGRSLKIRARETAEVEETELQCPEMSFHQRRGHLVVLEKPETP